MTQPEESREIEAYERQLRALLAEVAARFNVPGICLELSANGRRAGAVVGTLAADGSLPMTRHARFAIGGVGNMLVSLMSLELAARGLIDIEERISTYLPELGDCETGSGVRVCHLLSHSGGHTCADLFRTDVREHYSWTRCLERLRATASRFNPGTVFSYSPTATVMLQEIVQRVSGSTASALVHTRLLAPLEIEVGSVYRRSDPPALAVASHVFSPATRGYTQAAPPRLAEFWRSGPADFTMSIADLVTLHDAIMDARDSTLAVTGPLPRECALALQQQVLALPFVTGGPSSEQLPVSTGLGCAGFAPDWIGRNSGPVFGQSVAVRYHEKHRIALAVGMNASVPSLCDAITAEVIKSLVDEDVQESDPVPVREAAPALHELEGIYVSPSDRQARVWLHGEDVVCELLDSSPRPTTRVALQLDDYGRWTTRSDPGRWPIGVFRDPTSGTPCLMVGMSAYRKESGAVAPSPASR